jgi:alanyl-tRNA synthetase
MLGCLTVVFRNFAICNMADTALLFLSDTFQFEVDCAITATGEDDSGPYVVTSATVFYPGGGGQEPDKGHILTGDGIRHPILKAAFVDHHMRHYVSEALPAAGTVSIRIDREHRLQNARLHTGGHLLSAVVHEKLKWPFMPVKGFHYQQGAYVEFAPTEDMPEVNPDELKFALAGDITKKLPVSTVLVSKQDPLFERAFKPEGFIAPAGRPLRLVSITPYLAYPCGGTHLHHTGELSWLNIKHIKHKKGNIRISYEVG